MDDYIKERNRALVELDIEWARAMMPNARSDAARLIAMHKARMHVPSIDTALRLESVEWLRERGFTDGFKHPLPPPGELPI